MGRGSSTTKDTERIGAPPFSNEEGKQHHPMHHTNTTMYTGLFKKVKSNETNKCNARENFTIENTQKKEKRRTKFNEIQPFFFFEKKRHARNRKKRDQFSEKWRDEFVKQNLIGARTPKGPWHGEWALTWLFVCSVSRNGRLVDSLRI